MKDNICPECGYPITNETICPECGLNLIAEEENQFFNKSVRDKIQSESLEQEFVNVDSPICNPTNYIKQSFLNIDWAQYFYECGVIGWEAFKKYFCFKGRASRREFWSFMLVLEIACLPFIIKYTITTAGNSVYIQDSSFYQYSFILFLFLSPMIGVMIRRLHDIGKSGWWCLCPVAPLFLYMKQSDRESNKYGNPYPAEEILKSKNIIPLSSSTISRNDTDV